MPSIGYGAGAYNRANGNFPPFVLINMFVEEAKTSEGGIALLSRPGLATSLTNGSGPINGMFARPGTLSGDLFTISGTALYRGTAAIASGTVTGTGRASFAGAESEVLVTRGATLHSYNGTNFASSGFTGNSSNNVTAVDFIGGLFVALEANSARFYWSDPLDGRSWDALNFATAERETDALLDVKALGDNIWLFGQSSIECWAHTGEADLPFTRFEQVTFDKGIHSTGAVAKADNSLIFVASNNTVYRIDEVPTRISDHSIEARIDASATVKMFTFQYQGHEFVAIRLASETLILDLATGEWHEAQTSASNWAAGDAAMIGDTAYFGNASDGKVMVFSGWQDLGADLERRFSAAQQLDQPLSLDNIILWMNVGQTTGAQVQMRSSNDAGQTWSAWEAVDVGPSGDYRILAEWRAHGLFDFPGFMLEFKCDDNCPFRVSAVKVNEPGGGRGR